MLDAIVFDLGGVLLNLDFGRTIAAFERLGAADFRQRWTPARQDPFFERFETGDLIATDFRTSLRAALGVPQASDADLDSAWNAMILDLPAANLQLLARLRRRYKVFLLSNTNEIHLNYLHTQLGAYPDDGLAMHFDTVYYSCRIGVRKPDRRSFETVLQRETLTPARTLFIDDLELNVVAARSVGMTAIHLAPGMTLTQALTTGALTL